MKFLITETDIRTALRTEGLSGYNISVLESVDVPVSVEGQPIVVRLMKVDNEWKWYGARMQDPPMDGSPTEVIQWLKANRVQVPTRP